MAKVTTCPDLFRVNIPWSLYGNHGEIYSGGGGGGGGGEESDYGMTIATSSQSRIAMLNGGIIISCSISWATVSVSITPIRPLVCTK